jgi:hypothetical protein
MRVSVSASPARHFFEQLRAVKPRLADCQFVLAREAGFESWPQMKLAVQSSNKKLAHQFVDLACLCYDDPHYDHRSFHARAHEVLARHPELAEANIWTAATAGNARAVESFLAEEPEFVNRPGPYGWTPLLCACYSRVKPVDPDHSTYGVAKLLLDRGADPNAYTMLLLECGASLSVREPFYDGTPVGWADFFDQTRVRDMLLSEGPICLFDALDYDRLDRVPDVLARDPTALNRTFAKCLSRDPRPEDWQTPLVRMVDRGKIGAVRVLLEHGADVTVCHPDGRSLVQLARDKGFQDITDLLQQHGAKD